MPTAIVNPRRAEDSADRRRVLIVTNDGAPFTGDPKVNHSILFIGRNGSMLICLGTLFAHVARGYIGETARLLPG